MTRLHRCVVKDCHELIPMTATTCGAPLCPKCGERHTTFKSKSTELCLCPECKRQAMVENGLNSGKRRRHKAAEETPKPRPRPILTDAEQRAHDLALESRLARERGYGNGQVRRLSQAEIDRIAGQITPLERIPERRFL